MAGINTVLSITNQMSSPLRTINTDMGTLISNMEVVNAQSGSMFSGATVNIENFNAGINQATDSAGGLLTMLKNVVSIATVIGGIKMVAGWVSDAFDASNTQVQAQMQLRTVLANMGAEEDAYDRIIAKAQELQQTSIYGDEAYMAGAAELATYMTDTDAILTMMDTLANYATGMSNGEALDATGMTDMATGLGKAMNGAYDALTKKGFEFTDAQKAIIEGTATQAQMVEALGDEYEGMTTDMMAAKVLSDAINEGWEGLAENMANTPEGALDQMVNSWGDVKEMLGNELTPVLTELFTMINSRMPQIQNIVLAVGGILSQIIWLLDKLVAAIGNVYDYAMEHAEAVRSGIEIIAGVVATLGAVIWNVALGAVNTVIDLGVDVWNFFASFANFFANFLTDPVGSVIRLVANMVDTIISLLETIATASDWVLGTNYAAQAEAFRQKVSGIVDEIAGTAEIDYRVNKSDFEIGSRIDEQAAFLAGVDWGDEFADAFGNYEAVDYAAQIALNTADISEDLSETGEMTTEMVSWLRDIAERDAINHFTTAEVSVNLGGVTNNLSQGTDIDGFITKLSETLSEELSTTAAAYNAAL